MRFLAVSALLALNCALSVRSAPITTGNPSGLSLAKRSSEIDAINIQIEIKQQQSKASQMDEQKQLNEQLVVIAAEQDMKKKEEEQQKYEELKQTMDKEQQQQQLELQNLLDEQKKLEEQEKEEQERIEAQLEKAKEMREMDSHNDDKNFVVIVIQIIIVVNRNGGWAPPRYETVTQVSYNQPSATVVQTQWITDSAVQYVTEGSPEETMAENPMSAVVVESSAQSIVSTNVTATASSMAVALTSSAAYMAGSPNQTMTSALMNYLPTTTANAMTEVPIETAMVGSATGEATTNIYGQAVMSEVPTETVAAPMMYDTPMAYSP